MIGYLEGLLSLFLHVDAREDEFAYRHILLKGIAAGGESLSLLGHLRNAQILHAVCAIHREEGSLLQGKQILRAIHAVIYPDRALDIVAGLVDLPAPEGQGVVDLDLPAAAAHPVVQFHVDLADEIQSALLPFQGEVLHRDFRTVLQHSGLADQGAGRGLLGQIQRRINML